MPTPKNAINLMPYMFSGDTKVRKHTVEDDRKYVSHLERVKNIKCAVDSQAPKTFRMEHSNLNSKVAQEKQDKIDRDNLLLVMRLEEIMNRKPQTIREKAEQKANPYEEKRERVYKEIENQNLKLVKRLVEISQKSEYDRKKLLAAGEKNQEHVRRLCRYNQPVEK